MNSRTVLAVVALLLLAASAEAAADAPVVNEAHPGLVSGCLATATLQALPSDVLVKYGDKRVTQVDVDRVLANASKQIRPQLEKHAVFLLQEIAVKDLLLLAAKEHARKKGGGAEALTNAVLISNHLQAVVADIEVSDAEVAAFYAQNTEMFGGASFDKVKRTLGEYVRKVKRQKAANRYIRDLGRTYDVAVNKAWWTRQAALALDNPVDKARLNKRPTMVDFGANGCRACDLMEPILKTLKKKYTGKADIVFVHVRKKQVLATRFGIQSIPVQVFFDAAGREVFRHSGFFAQADIEKKLAELGVK